MVDSELGALYKKTRNLHLDQGNTSKVIKTIILFFPRFRNRPVCYMMLSLSLVFSICLSLSLSLSLPRCLSLSLSLSLSFSASLSICIHFNIDRKLRLYVTDQHTMTMAGQYISILKLSRIIKNTHDHNLVKGSSEKCETNLT